MKVAVSSGPAAAYLFSGVRSKSIPNSRWRMRIWGCVQQCRRVGVVSREHDKSLATAGSSQRSGEVFHRLYLRSAGDGKSGKGVPNPRVVASDLSSGGDPPVPTICRGAFPPTGQADLNERSRHPKEKSRPIPTLSSVWQSCVQLFFPRPLPRSGAHTSASLERKLEPPISGHPIQHRGAKG